MTRPPLAAGQVSLRMYPHELPPRECVAEMLAQAAVAERAGFDGLMTSEHHGGFRGYVPNPLQLAGWLLQATGQIWAAPCPLLLPLRHWTHVAEELAWLACRFPDRVGAGFAVGGLARDFEMAELPFEGARARYREALPRVVAALRGDTEAPLANDPAIAACARTPIPVVAAAQGPVGARRAGRLGLGVLYASLQTLERMREVSAAHAETGCDEARIAIRRVWIGPPPEAQVAAQMKFYESYAPEQAQAHWGEGQELVHGETGAEVGERLAEVARRGGATALNLRVHVHGVEAAAVRDQIERLGGEALPVVREALSVV
jgi:alkanesulfonate monooxygenase SsuD/methylene tetrahydromethanopterin reductase-like flavin-dependent oxidoreductase (luciferase family)